ncbi:Ribokinase [Pseudocercospora fuligena]|uniref:Ribokinase n=1 Tax=Pseudocercospora fuligena TaxID=685502 RepID=A0A8H6RVT3_9PEZI|nr:Ribokinase [Pseudocercospora fuligena]
MPVIVAVIGSINTDLSIRTPRLPEAGETLEVVSLDVGSGGKGANQAVACARLAGEDVQVHLIARDGDDAFSSDHLAVLAKEQLDISHVTVQSGRRSGMSIAVVNTSTGENSIMYSAHANNEYPASLDASWDWVPKVADSVVFQLEIPLNVVDVVDTTAAGDTFVGAYVAKLARGFQTELDFIDGLRFASLAAAKTTQHRGAMGAIPFLKDL